MTKAWIGIGSNVGDRIAFCREGVGKLDDADGVTVLERSSLYETSPLGGPPQRSFINLVVTAETSLDARGLLETCQALETEVGRADSDIRWGPRVIDLDILLFGDTKISEPDLEVPHARMRTRRFVLVPMLEIDPDAADPWGARYADLLDEAEGEVRLLEPF